jgi:uncharacterized protein YjbI with pentapeptide repeats
MGAFSFSHSNFENPICFFRTHFEGYADFFSSNFGDVNFFNAHFGGEATFSDAHFGGEVKFDGAHFERFATFKDAHFGMAASFTFANFGEVAGFSSAHFEEIAGFNGTHFQRDVHFEGAHFEGAANFDANFRGDADFRDAHFYEDADFRGAHFEGGVNNFHKAQFDGNANFGSAQIGGISNFGSSHFEGEGNFPKAHFQGNAHFQGAHFRGKADFIDADFQGDANFDGTHFDEDACFWGAKFFKIVQFIPDKENLATFNRSLKLDNCKIYSMYIDAEFSDSSPRQISLQYPDLTHLFARWESIKDHIRYEGPDDDSAYLAIIKNYNNLGWFEDADKCYYEFRKLSQKRKNWFTKDKGFKGVDWSKILDWAAFISCGYGVRLRFVLGWMIGLIILFGIINFHFGNPAPESAFMSTMAFTASLPNNASPMSHDLRYVFVAERFLGTVLIALFVVVLTKKLIR